MSDDLSSASKPENGGNLDGALQFDRVEHKDGEVPKFACFRCKRWLHDQYFDVNGQPFCDRCRDVLQEQLTGPIAWSTWRRVLTSGFFAAAIGTAIYYAVLKLTGYQLGLISIVVGLIVGGAVRKASNARGGAKLQAVAIALTYASIVSSYIPQVFDEVMKASNQAPAAQKTASDPSAKKDTSGATTANPEAQKTSAEATAPSAAIESAADEDDSAPKGFWRAAWAVLLAGLVLFGLAAVAPWLAGFDNIMGWFIIGIALYEAWKLNRATPFAVRGPLQAPMTRKGPIVSEVGPATENPEPPVQAAS